MLNMLVLRDWQSFYLLTGTATATLIGLLFIAISIGSNLPRQQITNNLQTFVNPTLLYYFQVFLVSCLAVMPLQSPFIYIGAFATLGILNIVLTSKVYWRIRVIHSEDEIDIRHWIWHLLLPFTTGLLLLASAIGFLLGIQLAPLGLAIADLLCLTIGLHNTWILTLWLALHRDQHPQPEENVR
jgi:hypothetical protein